MGWGYFTNGTLNLISSETSTMPLLMNEGAHVVLSIPTPNMPTTGTATYTMIPGAFTTPTFSDNIGGGGFTPGGTVTSASMTVNFAAPSNQITGNASLSFPGGTRRAYPSLIVSHSRALYWA